MSTHTSLPKILLRFMGKEQNHVRSLRCAFSCFSSDPWSHFLLQLVQQWDTVPSWGRMFLFPAKASCWQERCPCLPYLLIFKWSSKHLVSVLAFSLGPGFLLRNWRKSDSEEVERASDSDCGQVRRVLRQWDWACTKRKGANKNVLSEQETERADKERFILLKQLKS